MRPLILVVMACVCALGQTAQERGKKLVDDLLAALGGQQFLTMKNRVEAGRAYSFYHEQLSGLSVATISTRYLDNPAPGVLGVEERESFGKDERFGAVLFAGGKGWQITYRGARPIEEERYQRYRESTLRNIFYILRERLREPGLIFEAAGTDTVDRQPIEKLAITDADNETVTVILHHLTMLPIRQSYFRRDPKTRLRVEETTIFAKYRDVGGGVQWPYDVQRLRDGDRVFQMYADTVTINQDLKDELFELPKGMKVLPPPK